jgi:hypothetical protein
LLSTPITNYQQRKTIFGKPYMRAEDLLSPREIMAGINYLADNKHNCIKAREVEWA